MGVYNPASLRVKEVSGGNNTTGVVTLEFPDGSVSDQGRGIARINIGAVVTASLSRVTLTGTQDGVNAVFTIPGTDTWTTVWVLRNAAWIDTTTYSVGGTGNRTVTMLMTNLPDASAPAGAELLEVVGVHS